MAKTVYYNVKIMRYSVLRICNLFMLCCRPVHLTRFTADGTQIFSGSDDKTVRIWDISTESELQCFSEHKV